MRDADAAARGRRQDGADAAAVGQAGVEHRVIGGDGLADELRDVAHRRLERVLGGEARVGALELAGALDEDLLEAVDHDLGARDRRADRAATGARKPSSVCANTASGMVTSAGSADRSGVGAASSI